MIFGIILSGDIKKTFRSMSSQLLIIYDYETLRKIPVNFKFSYKIRLALAYIGFTMVPMFIFVGQRLNNLMSFLMKKYFSVFT